MGLIKRLIRREEGSLTLEAAMVLPFFMLFMIFLATLIRIAIADMALYKATSETSEIIVSFAYPAEIVTSYTEDLVKDKFNSMLPDDLDVDEVLDYANKGIDFFFPDADIEGNIQNFFDSLAGGVLEKMIQSKFADTVGNDTIFKKENLRVDDVKIPSLVGGSGGDYLKIDVSYDIGISFPFVNKTITLSKTSYERIWTGS